VPADARAIAEVHVRSWRAGYRGLMPDEVLDGLSVEDREEMWRQSAAADLDDGLLLVAERDGAVAGFCAVATPSRDSDAPPGTAEIGAIYVDPQAWRSGTGRALMGEALGHLQSAGWAQVTLWVLEGNRQAIEFYSGFGFAADGARQFYERSGTTGVRLRRSLSPDGSH
jgi:ribosomal protein S18 acetylase RimI-like enzyme